MIRNIFKMFIVLLSSTVNASNHPKCVSVSNHKCQELQELHHYPFVVKLDRCAQSSNTPNYLSNKACVPNKTENLKISVFNMITGIIEPIVLTKHKSCECKCKFDERKCNSNQMVE